MTNATDDEILAIAMEHYHGVHPDDPEWQKPDMISFARAIAAAEREACAEVCMQIARNFGASYNETGVAVANGCATDIRARGET